jgi:Luciferase-like monooxygenase
VKFGISYNPGFLGSDPDQLIAVARHAEECGFESFYVPEHIVLYPGATLGPAPIRPALPFADPLECLSFVAAATSRILLGTAVLLVPYHHPVVLAKRLATIDVLSKGRMRLLTVGLGTLPGGRLAAPERARQLGIMRAAAEAAGRDAGALEYTRWGAIDMSAADVGTQAGLGVTRLVVGVSAASLDEQREEMSAFAGRLGLG